MPATGYKIAPQGGGPRSFPAGEVITEPGRLGVLNASGQVIEASGAAVPFIGIITEAAAAVGDMVRVQPLEGFQYVRAASGVAINDVLTSDADGRVEATTTDTDEIAGLACEAAAAAGDLILIACRAGTQYAG